MSPRGRSGQPARFYHEIVSLGGVIELGLLAPEGDRQPPRPAGSRRSILAAVAVAAVLLGVAGAVAPAGPGLVPVRTATVGYASTFQLIDDTLYVAQARPDGNSVTAYPLSAGPPRWSAPIDLLAGNASLDGIDEVVVVSVYQPGVHGAHTMALDRATGAVRWLSRLSVMGLDRLRDRVLLTEVADPDAEQPAQPQIMAVSADRGEPAWTYRRDGACQAGTPYEVTDARTGLAVLCPDGTLSLVDLADGHVRASVDIPGAVRGPDSGSGFGPSVIPLDDRILVSYPGPGSSILTSFDVDRLRPQWRAEVDHANYGVSECGSRICLLDSRGVVAVDRVTGALPWRVDTTGFSAPLGQKYVIVAPPTLGDVRLVDADTGATVLNLGRWTAEERLSGPPLFFRLDPIMRTDRASRADPVVHRTWVATLSMNPIGLRLLGVLPDADPDTCDSTENYLACRTVKDTVQVWRLAGPR